MKISHQEKFFFAYLHDLKHLKKCENYKYFFGPPPPILNPDNFWSVGIFATDRKRWVIAPKSYSLQYVMPPPARLQDLAHNISMNDTPWWRL